MLLLFRKNLQFFVWAIIAAVLLRAGFVIFAKQVTIDSRVYADIAQNWLNYHIYSISDDANIRPTLVRLPGYPAFLAVVFVLFGYGNFTAVMWVQVALDVITCVVVADIARRTISDQSVRPAFLLAALCPFTANYVALPLTETLAILCTATSIDLATIGLLQKRLRPWILCGVVLAFGILLRPDSGLLLGSIGLFLLYRMVRIPMERKHAFVAGILLAVISLAPLVPWTVRNWRTFHVFQPLVTMDANDPGEYEATGWRNWLSNWLYDYVSEEDFLFKVPGEEIKIEQVPSRAFASREQYDRIKDLFNRYNVGLEMTPDLDREFAQLAHEYARARPFRTYLAAPLVRLGDMWLRPRIEMLSVETRWWEYKSDPRSFWIAAGLGLLNITYLGLAGVGLYRRSSIKFVGMMGTFLAVRSVFLMYAGVAEPRYMLECYPLVFVMGAAALSNRAERAIVTGS